MSRYYINQTTISILHGFYANDTCADFEVTPCAKTAALLRGYRMMWGTKNRTSPSRYELLQESADGTNPLLPLPATAGLCFGMELKHPHFINFTNLPARSGNEVYIVRNSVTATALTIEAMELVSAQMQLDGLSSAVTVAVTCPEGTSNFSVVAVENGTGYSARINFAGKPSGVYELSWPGDSQLVFVSPELYGKGLFGILYLQNGDDNVIGGDYTLTFEERSAYWKYFLVLRGDHSDWVYDIEGASLTFDGYVFPPPVGPPPPPAELTAVADEILPMLGPTDSLWGYISTSDVDYTDVVRSSIALTRVLAVGAIGYPSLVPIMVMSNLPNPSLGSATATVVVSVDAPLT
jgi:hypothetical protein